MRRCFKAFVRVQLCIALFVEVGGLLLFKLCYWLKISKQIAAWIKYVLLCLLLEKSIITFCLALDYILIQLGADFGDLIYQRVLSVNHVGCSAF